MRYRSILGLMAACLVCGCSGAVHRLPQISTDELSMAQTEVKAAGGSPQRRVITDEEARETVHAALIRIRPAADQLCREMSTGVCTWTFRTSSSRSLNAHAGPNGLIVVNRGIVEYATSEEEVAMVIAHEVGHQAANHYAANQRNHATGALVGAVLLGAVGAAVSHGSHDGGAITRAAMNAGSGIGGAVGLISFSKEQEREADYLAALILYRAGLDLDKARAFQVTMAKASGQTETGMLDTHPAGPERIAAWDRAVQEIRASNGRLPQRAR